MNMGSFDNRPLGERVTQFEDAARKALAVLRTMEWDRGDWDYSACQACERWRKVGHAGDCALAEAIRDMEAAL